MSDAPNPYRLTADQSAEAAQRLLQDLFKNTISFDPSGPDLLIIASLFSVHLLKAISVDAHHDETIVTNFANSVAQGLARARLIDQQGPSETRQ